MTHTLTPRTTHNGQLLNAADVVSVGYAHNESAGRGLRIQLTNGEVIKDIWPSQHDASEFAADLAYTSKRRWLWLSHPQWVAPEYVSSVKTLGTTGVRVVTRSGEAITDHWYSSRGRDLWVKAMHHSMLGTHGLAVQLAELSRLYGDPSRADGEVLADAWDDLDKAESTVLIHAPADTVDGPIVERHPMCQATTYAVAQGFRRLTFDASDHHDCIIATEPPYKLDADDSSTYPLTLLVDINDEVGSVRPVSFMHDGKVADWPGIVIESRYDGILPDAKAALSVLADHWERVGQTESASRVRGEL